MDFASMPKDDLLEMIATCGLDVPEGLPEAIVARGSEMLGPLCEIVSDLDAWHTDPNDPGPFWFPVHAMHLLGAIGDPAAAEALLVPLSDAESDEFRTEDGPGVLAHLGPGAIPTLRAFALEHLEDGDDIAVALVVAGLIGISMLHPDHADAGVTAAREVVAGCHERGLPVPALVALGLARVGTTEDHALLRETFDGDEWSDYMVARWEDVERAMADGPRDHDVEWWTRDPMGYFAPGSLEHLRAINEPPPAPKPPRPTRPTAPRHRTLSLFDDALDALAAPPPKPGRNEPCPCGSGKKYKKCCGR